MITDAATMHRQLNAALELVAELHVAQTRMADSRAAQDLDVASIHATLRAQLDEMRQRVEALHDKRRGAVRRLRGLSAQRRQLSAELQVLREDREGATESRTLDRVRGTLQACDRATCVSDVLQILVDALGQAFRHAAIFMIRGHGLEGWRSVGLDPTIDVTTLAFPLTVDSLLTRALHDRSPSLLTPLVGLFGTPVAGVIAAPIAAGGRAVAVAYAEQVEALPERTARMRATFACVLTDHASRCLRHAASDWRVAEERAAPAPASMCPETPRHAGPAREEPRIRMRDGCEVTLEGQPGRLVDLSRRGAQVLTSQGVRPNQFVRLTLPHEDGRVLCKARIMWARFELGGTGLAQYRVGLKLIEPETAAMEAVIATYGQETDATVDTRVLTEPAPGDPPRRHVG